MLCESNVHPRPLIFPCADVLHLPCLGLVFLAGCEEYTLGIIHRYAQQAIRIAAYQITGLITMPPIEIGTFTSPGPSLYGPR